MSPEQTRKANAANIEALRLMIVDALLRAPDADKAMEQREHLRLHSLYEANQFSFDKIVPWLRK